jgi:ubiquitin thioesterase protein OTUB1
VRLQSMNNLLNGVGFVQDIYEDFAEQAFELLQTLAASVRAMDGRADRILLETFNDYGISMAIVTYFKVCTAWLICLHRVSTNHAAAAGQCLDPVTSRRLPALHA